MSATTLSQPAGLAWRGARRIPTAAAALLTLAGRRASLTSRTPRQIAVPLLGPLLLALVAAPALKAARPLFKDTTPVIANQLRPVSVSLQPLARTLAPAAA